LQANPASVQAAGTGSVLLPHSLHVSSEAFLMKIQRVAWLSICQEAISKVCQSVPWPVSSGEVDRAPSNGALHHFDACARRLLAQVHDETKVVVFQCPSNPLDMGQLLNGCFDAFFLDESDASARS